MATTIGTGIVDPDMVISELLFAALLSAIAWKLITWWLGIPSSSSHALVFSIVGAGIASAGTDAIPIDGVSKVLRGMVCSPVLGFLGAFLLLFGLLWIFAASAHNE